MRHEREARVLRPQRQLRGVTRVRSPCKASASAKKPEKDTKSKTKPSKTKEIAVKTV